MCCEVYYAASLPVLSTPALPEQLGMKAAADCATDRSPLSAFEECCLSGDCWMQQAVLLGCVTKWVNHL